MYCIQCGAKLPDHAKFCNVCGAPQEEAVPAPQPEAQPAPKPKRTRAKPAAEAAQAEPKPKRARAPKAPEADGPVQVSKGGPVGFSAKVSTPEFKLAERAGRRFSAKLLTGLLLAPPVLMTLWGIVGQEMDLIYYTFLGVCISAPIAVVTLLAWLIKKTDRQWDGVVEKQVKKAVIFGRKRSDRTNDDGDTIYRTVVRGDDGRRHNIDERGDTLSYGYLKVGDRVRHHPQPGLNYSYEKYDKSKDKYIVCVFCRHVVDIHSDTCSHCGKPLLN